MKKHLSIAVLLLLLPCFTYAQQGALLVRDLDATAFPIMRANILAFDRKGEFLKNIDPAKIIITENSSMIRPVLSLECRQESSQQTLSSVVALDISSAMAEGGMISIAKAAASSWIRALSSDTSETLITGFNHNSHLYQDFSRDTTKLLKTIDDMNTGGGREFTAALARPVTGAFELISRGNGRRALLIISNGDGGGDAEAIAQLAQLKKTKVYAIGIKFDVSPVLKKIAQESGGEWFAHIQTVDEAAAVARWAVTLARGGNLCSITWQSDANCAKDQYIQLHIAGISSSERIHYTSPFLRTARLEIYPTGIDLGGVRKDNFKDTTIVVKAVNGNVYVNHVESTHQAFSVIPRQFMLQEGDSLQLAIRFSPQDSSIAFGKMSFKSDACSAGYVYIRGGFPEKTPNRILQVLSPNGTEKLISGSRSLIRWTGALPQDTVIIEYTSDGGETWQLISNTASGMEHEWQVPDEVTEKALVRISLKNFREAHTWRVLSVLKHKTPVQRAIISADGTKVLTLDTDDHYGGRTRNRTARLWDASSGKLLYTLPDSGRIGAIAYSRSGKYTATSFSDTAVYNIIETETGQKVATSYLPGEKKRYSVIMSLDIHPDDERVVLGDLEGEVHFQNIFTASDPFNVIQNQSFFYIRGARYSTDGSSLIVSGDTVSVYTVGGRSIAIAPSPSMKTDQYDYGADISPNGSKAVVSTLVGSSVQPSVWNIGNWQDSIRYFALPFPRAFARSNRFSWDGKLLVTGVIIRLDTVNPVVVFDVTSGSPIATLSAHTSLVLDACFSRDARRIASASADRTVIVWEKSPEPDSSDTYFSIAAAQSVAGDIDLGVVSTGAAKDSVTMSFLCNLGSAELPIDSISIASHGQNSLFSVTPVRNIALAPFACSPAAFRFAPRSAGEFSDTIRITAAGITSHSVIRAKAVQPSITFSQLIDFGIVTTGSSKDTTIELAVVNNGIETIHFTGAAIAGPDTSQFSVVSGHHAFSLLPGKTHFIRVRYSPDSVGRVSSAVRFRFAEQPRSGYWPETVIQLFGEGVCAGAGTGMASVQFAQQHLRARTGEIIRLPLKVIPPGNSLQNVPRGYSCTIRFNKTVLLPVFPTPLGYVEGNNRVIELSGNRKDTSNIFTELVFATALGDTDQVQIKVENFEWATCGVDVEQMPALIVIENICETDGAKRFFVNTEVAGIIVNQNSFGSTAEIQYRIIEGGVTDIFIINLTGKRVLTIRNGETAPGNYVETIDTQRLANGVYFLIMRTPTQAFTQRLEKFQ